MPTDLDHPPATDPVLHDQLRRWIAASLITPAEANAIQAFEAHTRETEPRRIPMITEALAYVGAALAAAAAVVLVGGRWDELTAGVRVGSVAAGCAVTLLGGIVLRARRADPAIERLTSVLWAIATGLFGWLAWLVAHDVLELGGDAPAVWCGIAIAVLGGALYLALRQALQQFAVFAGLLTIVGASIDGRTDLTLTVWTIGVAWTALGLADRLPPERAALVGGPVVALWAPLALTEGGEGFGMWLGLATAAALIVMSLVRHRAVLLGIGTVGVFVYLIRIFVRLFGDTAAMPVALLVAGGVVIGVAVWLARRAARDTSRSARRSPS